ncbi:MAG: DUF3515 domain-containing protein [Mycobacteriaceae bacterium]|nr:DUF3515 domain-containing protein [Mycobacteriaceae bacterium]
MASPDGPPKALLITALALAVTAIGAVLAMAVIRQHAQQPVPVSPVPVPQAHDPACRRVLAALPSQLGDYHRVATPPSPAGTVVWRNGSAVVVLRCGLERPTDFVLGSPIQVVDHVQWFAGNGPRSGEEASYRTWYTVDRPVYLALTLPHGSGPTPIQQLSEVIDQSIPAVPHDTRGTSPR